METNVSSEVTVVKSDSNDLDNAGHASVLAEHVAEIRRLGKRAIEDVIEIGRRLTECKKIVGHGNWLTWLEREFGWSEATARNSMHVYELAQSTSVNFADLNLPVSSVYVLAAPSTPEAARTEILERVAAGEQVSSPEVKETIAEAKRAKASTPESSKAENLSAERVATSNDHAAEQGDAGHDQHENDGRHHNTTEEDGCEPKSLAIECLINNLTKILRAILNTKSPAEQLTAIAQFNKALDQENYDCNDVEVRISKCFPSNNPKTPARILANTDRSD
jgi:hypothetical protein